MRTLDPAAQLVPGGWGAAPSCPGPARAGSGSARLEAAGGAGGRTVVTSLRATSPLKLLSPRMTCRSAWIFASSFGGGLVAGDHVSVDLHCAANTRAYFSSQSATKVYRSIHARGCRQDFSATLGPGALLVCAPDPVICFAHAIYSQHQAFNLHPTSSLVLLDWFTSGRLARGERFAFSSYASRNDITIDGKHLIADALVLDRHDGPIDAPHRMGAFNCMATLMLIGPILREAASALHNAIRSTPVRGQSTLASASELKAGGVIVRILGSGAEPVARAIKPWLTFIAGNDFLGDDPFARKW